MAYLGGAIKSQTVANPASVTVVLPSTSIIPVGAVMLLGFSYADNSSPVVDDPAGWTSLGVRTHTTVLYTKLYWKVRAVAEPNPTVAVESPSTGKSTLWVKGESGLDTTTPYTVSSVDETVNRLTHTPPAIAGVAAGSSLTEWVTDRGGPGSTSLTPSGSISTRLENYQTGGGALSTAMGDPGATVSGTVGADPWTGTLSTNNANMWTIIGNPAAPTTVVGKNFSGQYGVRQVMPKLFSGKYNIGASVAIGLVSSVSKIGATGTSVTFNGPTGMSVNQVQILFIDWASNDAMTADPTGNSDGSTWTAFVPTSGTNPIVKGTALSTKVFWRIVKAGDNGKAYTATLASTNKYEVTIHCYQQLDTTNIVDFIAFLAEGGVATTNHVMPTGTVATAGAWLLEHVADRGSPGSTLFTAPSTPTAMTKRQEQYDTGGGAVSQATGDSANSVATGTRGGETWVGTLNTTSATMVVLALKPAVAAVTAVGKNFSGQYGIRKAVPKLFSGQYNIGATIIIRIVVDDDMNLTDAGFSMFAVETIDDSMGLLDDANNTLGKVQKNFSAQYNILQVVPEDFTGVYNINPLAGKVQKDFTGVYAIKQHSSIIWTEEDGTKHTIWTEP